METDSLPTRLRVSILQQYPVNGRAVRSLAEAAYAWLEANKQTVNALNVFPVPDGDTGTNMVLTMKSAVEEMRKVPETKAGEMLAALAQGALMGARGNSGVILSQLWRGFARSVEGKDSLNSHDLAQAFVSARDTAYKGVVRPVEGTILTVAKDMAAAAEEAANEGLSPIPMLHRVMLASKESVQRTPELLPILKQAGVVDSGGKGLSLLMEGMLRWVEGHQLHTAEIAAQPMAAMNLEAATESVEEGQDYEVVVDFRPHQTLDLPSFYADLEKMGTSIQVGEGQDMYRMHIHVPADKRDEPLNYIQSIGTWTNVKMENLMSQMDEIRSKISGAPLKLAVVQPGEVAVVAVASGSGIARHFAELGAAAVVEGGQTMNPSTADLLAAFENLPTEKIIILPNNKNILMAANSAAELSAKKAVVVPTTSVPEGFGAMLRHNPKGDLNAVAKDMKDALAQVETGEITTATRDVEIDGVKVKVGQIIGLHNDKLVIAAEDVEKACLKLLAQMKVENYDAITLFYGEDVHPDQANEIAEAIQGAYSDKEVDVHEGGQPHYQFILSVE
jgi:DAK2 domain fusion protein YloV